MNCLWQYFLDFLLLKHMLVSPLRLPDVNLLEFPLKLNKGERCFQVHRPPPLLSIANTHPKDNRSSASFSSQNHYLPSETGMPTKISDMTGMAQLLAMQL